MNQIDEIKFVNEQIQNQNYVVLPDTIAIGSVYKISAFGNLNDDGYEVGYLYLPAGSGIKEHVHVNDIERYKLLSGILRIKDSNADVNICLLDNSHCIDKVTEPTIIQTCKINKNYLGMLNDFSTESFDRVVYQEKNQKIQK